MRPRLAQCHIWHILLTKASQKTNPDPKRMERDTTCSGIAAYTYRKQINPGRPSLITIYPPLGTNLPHPAIRLLLTFNKWILGPDPHRILTPKYMLLEFIYLLSGTYLCINNIWTVPACSPYSWTKHRCCDTARDAIIGKCRY